MGCLRRSRAILPSRISTTREAARDLRAVRDEYQRCQTFPRRICRNKSSTRSAEAVSRLPVGSSAMRSDGRCTSAPGNRRPLLFAAAQLMNKVGRPIR